MTAHDDLLKLIDTVNALTEPRLHEEPYAMLVGAKQTANGHWVGGKLHAKKHTTHVTALLDQLADALEPGSTIGSGHAIPGSRPAARLEAIDVLLRIDCESSQWVDYAGLHLRPSITGNLRALVGAAATLEAADLGNLSRNAVAWLTAAQVTTGWEVPAFKPDNTCPLCAVKGGLRIRGGDGVTSSEMRGLCVFCGEHWTPETIGLLADHIRSENADETLGETA